MKHTTILIFLLLLAGCSSKSNFYQLHPTTQKSKQVKQSTHSVYIGIGEVSLSEYLEKTELVTRLSAGRLLVNNDQLWAGSLAKNIQSVLRQNLSALLPRYAFLSYPWEEPISDRYRIYLTIDRFDGDAEGVVTLKGHWSLVSVEENDLIVSEAIYYRESGSKGLDGIVSTQSRILEKLSRHLATRLGHRI